MTSLVGNPSTRVLPKYAEGTQPYTVFIEGNIGSGKTTFLNHFQQYDDLICVLKEPVEKWRNVKGHNLLDLMYKDPKRWAMPFQSYVTLSMLQSHTHLTNKPIKLMERSMYSARHCFVESMRNSGSIEEGMYQILQEWYDFIEKSIHIRADLIVYLRTSPEVVLERMRKRARSEESAVPLTYLQELHELHEDWLIHKRHGKQIRTLVLDANLDLDNIVSEYNTARQEIIHKNEILLQTLPMDVLVSPSKRRHYNC